MPNSLRGKCSTSSSVLICSAPSSPQVSRQAAGSACSPTARCKRHTCAPLAVHWKSGQTPQAWFLLGVHCLPKGKKVFLILKFNRIVLDAIKTQAVPFRWSCHQIDSTCIWEKIKTKGSSVLQPFSLPLYFLLPAPRNKNRKHQTLFICIDVGLGEEKEMFHCSVYLKKERKQNVQPP